MPLPYALPLSTAASRLGMRGSMKQLKRPRRAGRRSTVQRHVVENPNGPDLEFFGECLLKEDHECTGAVAVYRTRGGTLVASQLRRGHEPDGTIERVSTIGSIDELASWLGHSRGAKAILAKLGHPVRRWLD